MEHVLDWGTALRLFRRLINVPRGHKWNTTHRFGSMYKMSLKCWYLPGVRLCCRFLKYHFLRIRTRWRRIHQFLGRVKIRLQTSLTRSLSLQINRNGRFKRIFITAEKSLLEGNVIIWGMASLLALPLRNLKKRSKSPSRMRGNKTHCNV